MPTAFEVLSKRFSALGRGWGPFLVLLVLGALRRLWRGAAGPASLTSDGGKGGGRGQAGRGRGGSRRGTQRSGQSGGGSSAPSSGGARSGGAGASESEIGPAWHFGGRRRWAWMHDGHRINGWIEFQAGGVLRTSFEHMVGHSTGVWELQADGKMRATFGRCHHFLELEQQVDGAVPSFRLKERTMKDGSATRDRGRPKTRGQLAEAATAATAAPPAATPTPDRVGARSSTERGDRGSPDPWHSYAGKDPWQQATSDS